MQFAPTSAGADTATLKATGTKPGTTATDALFGTGASPAHLYWANNPTNEAAINEANLDGTSPLVIVTGQFGPLGVAVGPQ